MEFVCVFIFLLNKFNFISYYKKKKKLREKNEHFYELGNEMVGTFFPLALAY